MRVWKIQERVCETESKDGVQMWLQISGMLVGTSQFFRFLGRGLNKEKVFRSLRGDDHNIPQVASRLMHPTVGP